MCFTLPRATLKAKRVPFGVPSREIRRDRSLGSILSEAMNWGRVISSSLFRSQYGSCYRLREAKTASDAQFTCQLVSTLLSWLTM
jgi:hypothetical protein